MFGDLALHLLDIIPKRYVRIDFIAGTYSKKSIKDPERLDRGQSEKILFKSSSLQHNSDNERRLVEVKEDFYIKLREYVILNWNVIPFIFHWTVSVKNSQMMK